MTRQGYRLALRAALVAGAWVVFACSSRHRLGRLDSDTSGAGGSRGTAECGTAACAGAGHASGGYGTAADGAMVDGAAGDGAAGGDAIPHPPPGEFVAH